MEPQLPYGVIRVVKRSGKWIVEDRGGFVERNPVFLDVLCGFVRVPFEVHRRSR